MYRSCTWSPEKPHRKKLRAGKKLQAASREEAASHEPRAASQSKAAESHRRQVTGPAPRSPCCPLPSTPDPRPPHPRPLPRPFHPPSTRLRSRSTRRAVLLPAHPGWMCGLVACSLWLAGCSWLAASSRLAASCSSFPRSAWERNIFDAPRRVAVHNPRSTEASSAGAGPCPNPTPVLPLCGLASALPLLPLRETLLHPCSSVFICGFYHPPGSEIEIEDEIEIDGVVGLRPPLYHPTTLSLYHSSPPLTPSPAPPPAPAAATPRTPPRQSPCARNRCRPRNPPTAP